MCLISMKTRYQERKTPKSSDGLVGLFVHPQSNAKSARSGAEYCASAVWQAVTIKGVREILPLGNESAQVNDEDVIIDYPVLTLKNHAKGASFPTKNP